MVLFSSSIFLMIVSLSNVGSRIISVDERFDFFWLFVKEEACVGNIVEAFSGENFIFVKTDLNEEEMTLVLFMGVILREFLEENFTLRLGVDSFLEVLSFDEGLSFKSDEFVVFSMVWFVRGLILEDFLVSWEEDE